MKPAPCIAVIGAGTMGHGIAAVAALAGCEVSLTDAAPERLAEGLERAQRVLTKAVERGTATPEARTAAAGRLHAVASLAETVARVDVVIEAIPEHLELKQRLFAELEVAAPPDAILASNTSSLSITEIARPLHSPERVIGLHFFNPVPVMRLVEIVRGRETADATVTRACRLVELLGKEAIVVRDSPGFATSRLGVVLGLEAIRMLEQGVASAEDIDRAMELGYNHPIGPLRLTDLVGLDVRLAIAEYLHATLGADTYRPPELLRAKVQRGELGKKTGQGFYRWGDTP